MARANFFGKVTIKNGDNTIVYNEPNEILSAGLKHLVSCILCYAFRAYTPIGICVPLMAYSTNILFGKRNELTGPTYFDLLSKIATNPSTITVPLGAQDTTDAVVTIYNAHWAAGVLNASLGAGEYLGEVGLYLRLLNVMTASHIVYTDHPSYEVATMFSRCGLGASSFIPDPTKDVDLTWAVGCQFR